MMRSRPSERDEIGRSSTEAHLSGDEGSSYAGNGVLACHVLRGQKAELDAPLLQRLRAITFLWQPDFQILWVQGLVWPHLWPSQSHDII